MKNFSKIFFGIALLAGWTLSAQQTPAGPQSETISITGATLHIGNGEVIENGTVVFSDGKITAIGSDVAASGRVIEADGKHVYPGFIAPAKSLGLIEINAVRATDDQDEIGAMIPHIRSLIAYNAESQVVESMRPNGILLGQTTPQGGTISGTSSIVQFDAWNWEDAAVKTDDGIHLHWPRSFRRGRWWLGEPRGLRFNKDYTKETADVLDFVRNSKAYGAGENAPINPAFAAMQGLFDGSKTLYIYANTEREIIDGVGALKEAGIAKIVLVGGYQAKEVAAFLKEENIPVLVQEPHALPAMDDDNYDYTYQLPKDLVDAGLLVGLQNEGMSNFQTRNLPFYAGHVAGMGLDREEALKLITGNTAKILGIDDNYGTLETGKSATLFISAGDALDMRTNQLSHAFIDGREISLETHQTELWQRYSNKYSGE
ncbi:Imidazolonepropionase [Robiginitalea myxolifaciens]|uniref:Imidazolonepropionase n=1 Tax=Robiginitalea myxolifaciens TaxID=400055 RepID=A0A1I6FNH6_9FLAO|nr:amidohydrolase family protein [Robiginitalea myxolifaciens]SFR31458.1 Imidazolonepropionase [Robiginitalea myxolifaciens]